MKSKNPALFTSKIGKNFVKLFTLFFYFPDASGSSKNDQAIKRPPTTSPNEKNGNNKVPKWFKSTSK